jgi:telomeric repeat-binding factor 2-interacting protein 1
MNADSTHTEPYPPHTPNAHERPAPSQKPTTTAAPANTRRFPARRSPDKSAMAQGNAEKRKRLSEETLPTIPGFDVNELASRKRRATDFIPRGEPSTPDQPHRVRVKIDEKEIDNDTVHDDTNSIEFETAPQFSVSFNTAPSQSRPWTTDTNDDELNLQAFMELPFPPADSDSDGPGESVHEDKNDEQVARELDIWIADRLRTGRAKSEQHLVTALACTSMDPEVADRVLDSLAAGQGIPENMEGVWTDEDDATLEGTDARGIERLLKKHGTEFYSARFKYLAALREAQNASDRGV